MERLPNDSSMQSKNNLTAELDSILLSRFSQKLLLQQIFLVFLHNS